MENRKFLLKIVSIFLIAVMLTCSLFPSYHVTVQAAASSSKQQQKQQEQNGKAVGKKKAAQEAEVIEIEINTLEDFLTFADHCSLNAWSANKRVLLNKDIDLSDTLFEAVPVFAGTFDGQNHTISGFQYRGNGYVAGLFRYIEKNGYIENLNLKGEIITEDEKECIGGLCGVNYGTIENCSFQGTISGNTTIGGLVGVNEGTGVIKTSSAEGQVIGYYSTGGLVGRNHGTINQCTNKMCVNNNNEWVEEADSMGVGLLSRINVTDSDVKLFSGVDSGGIAGCSDGVIMKCVNYGEIGYEHTGYNVGGIAGRQSGVVSLCINSGTVYGRKDVGGIVGQMEPYIEVNEAETIRNAVNKLHSLIEKTAEDMADGKNTVKKDLDALTVYSDGAVDAGNSLAGQITKLLDETMDQAQTVADRLDHAMDMLPDVFDSVSSAEKGFSKANKALGRIGSHLEELGDKLGTIDEGLAASVDKLLEAQQNVNAIIEEIQNSPDISSASYLEKLQKNLTELADAAEAVMDSLKKAIGETDKKTADSLKTVESDMLNLIAAQQRVNVIIQEIQNSANAGAESFEKLQKALTELSDAAKTVIDNLKKAAGEVDKETEDSLKAVEDNLKKLTEAEQRVKTIIEKMYNKPEESASHIEELQNAFTELSDAAGAVISSSKKAADEVGKQTVEDLKAVESDLKKLTEAEQKVKTILEEMQKTPTISIDQLKNLQKAFTDLSNSITAVVTSLRAAISSAGLEAAESLKSVENELDKLTQAQQHVKDTIQEIKDSPELNTSQLKKLQEALSELSDNAALVVTELNTTAGDAGQQVSKSLKTVGKDMTEAVEFLQKAIDSIKTATKDAKSILDYVNGKEPIRFSKLGKTFDADREDLRDKLQGMSGCIRSLSDNASFYSDVVKEDFEAINDQMNLIFNLLIDDFTDYEKVSMEELYEDVDIEDIDSITIGKTDNCVNKGIVKGDINVGGIAGAMSIDEEDLESSAAGSVEYQIGRKFFTKCLITGCTNEGYITAKKDGAGGIAGYMRHGIVIDSEGYGSVESTEGDYVGGICGESFTIIKHCYALCSVSGGKNVGGIAGFANTLKGCYALVDCSGTSGRIGAIAGQTGYYDDTGEEEEGKVSRNYYVGTKLYGIDNISYKGIAEPISYEEMLKVKNLPVQFRHLKVIFKVDDSYLGTQEVSYGESLSKLNYPAIPEKEGHYGVWPDYSDHIMESNLLIVGEYKEDITVVQSNEVQQKKGSGQEDDKQRRELPYALVEQRFTENSVLKVSLADAPPPEQILNQKHVVYDVVLEQAEISDTDTFAIRLYNPYEQAVVWGCKNGIWTELESKVRGGYLQVNMAGTEEMFCVAEGNSSKTWIISGSIAGAAAVLVLLLLMKKRRSRGK